MESVTAEAAAVNPPRRRAGTWLFWCAAISVVALDQLTKSLVREFLVRGESWPSVDWPVRIRYLTNTGAAFGILQDQTAFLVVMSIIGLGAIYVYHRNPPFDHFLAPLAIGMMLGGAVGNMIDRVRLGRVTDFIDFRFWPAFNVADSAISVGVVAIILGYAYFSQQARPPGRDDV